MVAEPIETERGASFASNNRKFPSSVSKQATRDGPYTMQKAKRYLRRVRAFIGAPRIQKQTAVVMASEVEYCDDPIFVLGAHRSGTTLLRRILNSHSRIYSPPESFYLRHYYELLEDMASVGSLGSVLDTESIETEIYNSAFKYIEAQRALKGKARFAEKTPSYFKYFNTIKSAAPQRTQFVMIVRDPKDIVYSIVERGWRLHSNDELSNFEAAVHYVHTSFDKLSSIYLSDKSIHLIRYEDLVGDPEATTKALFSFLNEKWSPEVLTPWEHEHDFGNEDPLARGLKSFSPSVGNWKLFPKHEQERLASQLKTNSEDFGYT